MRAKTIQLLLSLLALAPPAGAGTLDLTLLDPDPQVVQGTTSVAFDATISNPSSATIYLNGDGYSSVGPLVVDDGPFYANAPISLLPGQATGPIELFAVTLPAATPVGSFSGNEFSIFGGADGGTGTAFSDLADVDFSVTVVPAVSVPEVDSGAAMMGGLALLALLMAARRGRRGPPARRSGKRPVSVGQGQSCAWSSSRTPVRASGTARSIPRAASAMWHPDFPA
jgi:hypothetical protein